MPRESPCPLPTLSATVLGRRRRLVLPALALDCQARARGLYRPRLRRRHERRGRHHNDYEGHPARAAASPPARPGDPHRPRRSSPSPTTTSGIASLGFGGTTACFLGASTAKKPPEGDRRPTALAPDLLRRGGPAPGRRRGRRRSERPRLSATAGDLAAFWGWSAGARRFVPPTVCGSSPPAAEAAARTQGAQAYASSIRSPAHRERLRAGGGLAPHPPMSRRSGVSVGLRRKWAPNSEPLLWTLTVNGPVRSGWKRQ